MATKTARRPKTKPVQPVVIEETVTSVVVDDNRDVVGIYKRKLIMAVLLVVVLLLLFWYKTDTWPIVALVNGRPITRFQVNQELYKRNGQEALQGIIDEQLIRSEIAKKNIVVTDDEINVRLDEVKTSLGDNFDSAVTAQGLTTESLKDQLKLQLSMEKILSDRATVSAEEVKQLSTDEKDRESAEKFVRQQKLQQAISEWITELRTQAKVILVGQK